MPVFKNRVALRIARGLTAFLNLEAGLMRGEIPNPEKEWDLALDRVKKERDRALSQVKDQAEKLNDQAGKLNETRSRVEKLKGRLQNNQQTATNKDRELAEKTRQISELEKKLEPPPGVEPENVIWVFGTIRTGSTWLGSMMGDLSRFRLWNEPRVGELFGVFFYERSAHRRENNNFILSFGQQQIWTKSIRNFVLDSVSARYPKLGRDGYVVIKEPSGSLGAPLLMEALPESRMVFLIRDPRDVVSSHLDATREGSWVHGLKGNQKKQQAQGANAGGGRLREFRKPPEKLVKEQANMYLRYVGNSKEAYDNHKGPKTLVRYEELVEDTLGTMQRIYRELGIEVEDEKLKEVVEKHSWENIPEEKKGEGKFYRKGTPGGWKEDLTPEQVEIVEQITAPLLEEFYPEA